MRRRSIGTFIGALFLLWLPWMPEGPSQVLRGVVAMGLVGGLFISLLAKFPVRWTVGVLRVLVGAFGIWILSVGPIEGVAMGFGPAIEGVAAISCLLLSAGPMASEGFRRILYALGLGAAWALAIGFAYKTSSWSGSIFPMLGLAFVTARFNRWRASGRSSLVDSLEQIQKDSLDMLRAFDSPAPIAVSLREKFQRWRFELSVFLPTGPVLTQRIYRRIRKACERYPHTVISWQIAYAAAMAIEDYPSAISIVVDAQAHGFENVLDDRMLAYAMRAAYDPAWRSVLARAWQKESSQPTLWTKEEFYRLSGDPTGLWRMENPVFAKLQERLLVTPKAFEPQILRGSPASVTG